MTSVRPIVLTIAGSDPSGGAGIQADLKTFHQHGVYGASVLTLLTVQNTVRVSRVETVAPDLVGQQIDAVLEDLDVRAAKTGALGSAAVVEVVAERVRTMDVPVVVDPVMISKHGHALLDAEAQAALRRALLPQAFLLTPNRPEAEALSGRDIPDRAGALEAARALLDLGPRAVLLKGGHFEGPVAGDLLVTEGVEEVIEGPRIDTRHTHGTGCTLSAAIAARLGRGEALDAAVRGAKRYLTAALRGGWQVGRGISPVDHFSPTGDP